MDQELGALVSKKSKMMEETESAKRRCTRVIERVKGLPGRTITDSCRRTLLKLAQSELNFLSTLSSSSSSSSSSTSQLHAHLSVNIGHLEAVLHILHQPFITGVSRVCKPVPLLPSTTNGNNNKNAASSKSVHVDIVCIMNKNPVWIIVSDRNPKYVSWHGQHKSKGLKLRIQQLLAAANFSQAMKPSSIILFFSHGLADSVFHKLQEEFAASLLKLDFSFVDFDFFEELEGEWINVLPRSYQRARVLEIKVDCTRNNVLDLEHGVRDSVLDPAVAELQENHSKISSDDTFSLLLSQMNSWSVNDRTENCAKPGDWTGDDLINFDTTALVALISGISNGFMEKLLAMPETALRLRFKGNFEFVIAQVMSEIQNPIHAELARIISGKRGIICESVLSEFKKLVSFCGGPSEKLRAQKIFTCLRVVADSPSQRMMALPTTRKLALKNKVVFGTGDHWHAPTLTANMAFAKAVLQTGMPLSVIEHRPMALTGD